MSFVARQYSYTASYVPVRRHICTFDTFTRTVVRLHLQRIVAVFLTFSASDVGFELFVSNQPVAPSGKTWRSCSQSSWVLGNSWGFVSAPQCRCSLSTDAAAAEDDQYSSLRSPHDSSICRMHSDRLPLIHLKNFCCFIRIYCIPSEFWKPLVPYFIQDQNICMHCCSFKDFFFLNLVWKREHFMSLFCFYFVFKWFMNNGPFVWSVTEEESWYQTGVTVESRPG